MRSLLNSPSVNHQIGIYFQQQIYKFHNVVEHKLLNVEDTLIGGSLLHSCIYTLVAKLLI